MSACSEMFCRQETSQVEQEGSSEMHYFHQKNAVDLIKEFEDLIGECCHKSHTMEVLIT